MYLILLLNLLSFMVCCMLLFWTFAYPEGHFLFEWTYVLTFYSFFSILYSRFDALALLEWSIAYLYLANVSYSFPSEFWGMGQCSEVNIDQKLCIKNYCNNFSVVEISDHSD